MDIYKCPNCNTIWEIQEMNCGIFRCGVYKSTWKQIDPHLDEKACNAIKTIIWGCGFPLRFDKDLNKFIVCKYI